VQFFFSHISKEQGSRVFEIRVLGKTFDPPG